jgi:hypothetical protein
VPPIGSILRLNLRGESMLVVWRAAAVCLVAVLLAAGARAADDLFLMNQGDSHSVWTHFMLYASISF